MTKTKKKKTVFKVFDYMHCDDFAGFLERMAAKGWHFKEWGAGLVFEKGEPEQVIYAVEVFMKAKESDLRPEPKTQEFAQYCEAAGWEFVDAKQKFCIFKKKDDNAVEILTPEERVKNSVKSTFSVSNIILIILYGLNAVLQVRNMFGSRFSYNVFSTVSFFAIAVWSFLFLGLLLRLVYTSISGHKLRKQIENGQEIYIGSNKEGKKWWDGHIFSTIVLLFIFLFMLMMLENTALVIFDVFIFVGTLAFSVFLAKVRPESDTNMMIQVIFVIVYIFLFFLVSFAVFSEDFGDRHSIEDVPLKISDYREATGTTTDVSIYHEKNMLGSYEDYFLLGSEHIYYKIYRSDYDWILNRIWEEEFHKKYNDNKTDCQQEWEAEAAYRNEGGEYYVRYEKTILIFSEDARIPLNEEQISIICDKLKLR